MRHNIVDVIIDFYYIDKNGEETYLSLDAEMYERGTNPELKKFGRNNVLRDIIERDLYDAETINKIKIFYYDDEYCSILDVMKTFCGYEFSVLKTTRQC